MEVHVPTISPLEDRESVEQRVAQTLRDLIVDGELPAGTPLVQRDLAQQLGVSPTPVRAGLSQLEREGLVAVTPTGRAIVSRLTREDFEEIYAARLGLEGLAANLGARACGKAEISAMKETLRDLRRLAEEQNVNDYLHQRWAFHATCYRASGRQRLVDEVGRLFWRADRYNRLVLSTARAIPRIRRPLQGLPRRVRGAGRRHRGARRAREPPLGDLAHRREPSLGSRRRMTAADTGEELPVKPSSRACERGPALPPRRRHRRHVHRRRAARRRRLRAHRQGAVDARRLRPRGRRRRCRACSPSCGVTGDEIDGVVHASTVASNTVLEGVGARTALVTTKGFRDVLEMRRLRIPVLYDIQYQSPQPLVPRRLRYEVDERIGPRGETWTALDEDDRRATSRSRSAGDDVEAVAIALLHSYADDAHERRVEEIVREAVGDERLRDPLVGDPARDPRVRAHEHRRRQRLRRAGDHALPRLARRPPARGRHRRASSR